LSKGAYTVLPVGGHLFAVPERGSVATNVFLRRLHNFALDMNWLPWPVIPKRQWPAVHYKDKRAITLEEHLAILARVTNLEQKLFYELCWHWGGSQSDIANLRGQDIDYGHRVIAFHRQKTGSLSMI
jgi:integrase